MPWEERATKERNWSARLSPWRQSWRSCPAGGGEGLLRCLFQPLGYEVSAEQHDLDEAFPDWGKSSYFTVRLQGTLRLQDLLTHLYVLIPVLDDEKHYWVGDDEVEKLLRHGERWLAAHLERELITSRYLRHQKSLVRQALARLMSDETPDPEMEEESHAAEEAALERRLSLNEQRIGTVLSVLKASGAKRVLDLGCGEGRLLRELLRDGAFEEIVGMDVSYRALEIARERLQLDRLPAARRDRVKLIHGALTYRDRRLAGYDAAAVVEVIEHLDAARLAVFERVLFEHVRPATVVLTTPNAEYNVRFEQLAGDKLRHRDHRFEWTRAELRNWAEGVATRFGYAVRFLPVGPEDPVLGAPTQMGVFDHG